MDFETDEVQWRDLSVPMKPIDCTNESCFVQDLEIVEEAIERNKNILDAKYEAADFDQIVAESVHLNNKEQQKLLQLLEKYQSLFDGTLGLWKDKLVKIELKEGATPYHARSYNVPKAYEQTLRLEVERLVKIGVLKIANRSEWASPNFFIAKK